MDFVLDLDFDQLFVHEEEEQIVSARDIPPSCFAPSANSNNLHFPFVEPPPRARSLPSSTHPSTRPHHHPFTTQNPLIPSTSITRSSSSETASTQPEVASTEEEPIISPITVTRGLDRPREHKSIPQSMFPTRGGFKRIPGTASVVAPSSAAEASRTVNAPGTLRRIGSLPTEQFQIATRDFTSKQAASSRGDLSFTRKSASTRASSAEENPPQITSRAASGRTLAQANRKRVATD